MLPPELTPFVNRERELAALSSLIHDGRLLSLLGGPGVGKTRLAIRLAGMVRRHFRDGVCFVELTAVTDGGLLPAVIAGALGILEGRAGDTATALGAALSSRKVLLVLDNCEHLVDAVARLLDQLLRTCPDLTVLTTSRERIGVVGERAWRVPPLRVPNRELSYVPEQLETNAAVALFLERARRASASFAITTGNAAGVVELVRCLDGLPLAIELAAGWMATLAPGELVREVNRRYQILVARDRVVSERHSSLWAAIESGYERLDPASQELFCQLAVFAGGWNLGAMTTVCQLASEPAVEVLDRLVDYSFVTVVATTEGPTRYRLLEVVRSFAMAKLQESGRYAETQARFVERMVDLAESASVSVTSREGPRWLTALDAELDNLRAVLTADPPLRPELRLRLAVALVPYWHFRGLFNEGRRHLREVVAGADPAAPALVSVLNGLSWLSWAQGELASAARHARQAFATARRAGDRRGMAFALLRLAQAQFDAGRPAAAARTVARAAQTAEELHDQRLAAECILQLGQVAMVEGRLGEAAVLLRDSVRLLGASGHVDREAVALLVLGRLCLRQGRPEEAEALLIKSLTTLRDFALARHSVPILESLAAVAAVRGDDARAARLAGAAAGLLERMGARPPTTAPMRSALVAQVESALEAPGGARAYGAGRTMELRQAIAFALGDPATEERPRTRTAGTPSTLTARQVEVARLIAQSMSNKEVAARLSISERTVEGHVEQICNKLGFNSRVQIAAWVIRRDAAEE
jgi:non-specific serine/threonine protein kinase